MKNKTEEQIEKDAEVYWRCRKGEWVKLEEIIQNGGRNYFVSESRWTGIHYSAREGKTEITKLILEKEKFLNIRYTLTSIYIPTCAMH